MSDVSGIVEANLGVTSRIGTGIDAAVRAAEPIADAAGRQSTIAEQVAAASLELTAQVREIDATAAILQAHADMMQDAIGFFRIDDEDATPSEASPQALRHDDAVASEQRALVGSAA